MSGPRQPLNLVIAKGKKHLTNAEIEARQNGEVHPATDGIEALTAQGYKADVAYGWDEAKDVIEKYLQRD